MNQDPHQSGRRTTSQWQELIDQQRDSGITQKAFCELHNICLSTFTLWKRKLKPIAGRPEQPLLPESDWIEVQTNGHSHAPEQVPWEIELDLPGGVILRMRR
ncbi:IS66 family insertion sequence element accessory protein TnpA [Endozoicomonas ascidiicola]|uniref:IS66 family insertion sequence element accessory protein TnpA n=1 Tax=Endozoicomonas ascidiicola TaxID=1698521 RepID=UPI00082FB057|nr:hypothetical protein [Endozoicomonas ascidiicola]